MSKPSIPLLLAFTDLSADNDAIAKAQDALSKACWEREGRQGEVEAYRKTYAHKLKAIIQRRATAIVRKHSNSWCATVRIFPLHDHSTHLTGALGSIEWFGKSIKIEASSMLRNTEQVNELLARFERLVIANGASPKDQE